MNIFKRSFLKLFAPDALIAADKMQKLNSKDAELFKRGTKWSNTVVKKRRYKAALGIDAWRSAVSTAQNVTGGHDYNRVPLYDLYHEVVLDSAYISEFNKVYNTIMMMPFVLANENGKEDEKAKKYFQRSWFMEYVRYMFEAEMWGHSLVQVTTVNKESGEIKDIELIPRENVRPEKGLIAYYHTYADSSCIDYRSIMRENMLLEYGGKKNLGDLLTLVEDKIYKGFARSDWGTVSERWGQPFLVVQTDSDQEEELVKKQDMAENFGSAGYAILDKGDELKLIEAKATDSFQVFDMQIRRSDDYISRVITGQTMTSNSGDNGSRALGEVQERTETKHIFGRLTRFQAHFNEDLIPFLVSIGYPLQGLSWEYQIPDNKPTPVEDTANMVTNKPMPTKPKTSQQTHEDDCCDEKKKDIRDLVQADEDNTFLPLVEDAAQKIRDGVNQDIVHKELYEKISANLFNGWKSGAGSGSPNSATTADQYQVENVELMNRIKANLFAFSGAKTYAQMRELRDFIFEGGKLKPWNEVRDKAKEINAQYNITWLETERDMVIRGGEMGAKWLDIQRDADLYPYLRYDTARDAKVRDTHRAMEGIVLRADDDFWLKYYPPNGWNCRCSVEQLSESQFKAVGGRLTSNKTAQNAASDVPETFQRNYGTSEIFPTDGDNPYYKAMPIRPSLLQAVQNYGLQGAADMIKQDLPQLVKDKTDEAFIAAWDKLAEANAPDKNGGFILYHTASDGLAYLTDKLRQDMINSHVQYSEALEGLFVKPDEVWTTDSKYPRTIYITYHKGKALVGLVDNKGKALWVRDMTMNIEEYRKGVLLYSK